MEVDCAEVAGRGADLGGPGTHAAGGRRDGGLSARSDEEEDRGDRREA